MFSAFTQSMNPNPAGMPRSDGIFGGGTGNNNPMTISSVNQNNMSGIPTGANPLALQFQAQQQKSAGTPNSFAPTQQQQQSGSLGNTGNQGGVFGAPISGGTTTPTSLYGGNAGQQAPAGASSAGAALQPLGNLFSGLGGAFSGLNLPGGLGSTISSLMGNLGNAYSGIINNLGSNLTNYYQNSFNQNVQPQLQADLAQRGLGNSALGSQQYGNAESNYMAPGLAALSSSVAGLLPSLTGSMTGGLEQLLMPGLQEQAQEQYLKAQLANQEQFMQFQEDPGQLASMGRMIHELGGYNAGANYQNAVMANQAQFEQLLNLYGPAGVGKAIGGSQSIGAGGGMIGGTPGFGTGMNGGVGAGGSAGTGGMQYPGNPGYQGQPPGTINPNTNPYSPLGGSSSVPWDPRSVPQQNQMPNAGQYAYNPYNYYNPSQYAGYESGV